MFFDRIFSNFYNILSKALSKTGFLQKITFIKKKNFVFIKKVYLVYALL